MAQASSRKTLFSDEELSQVKKASSDVEFLEAVVGMIEDAIANGAADPMETNGCELELVLKPSARVHARIRDKGLYDHLRILVRMIGFVTERKDEDILVIRPYES